MALTREQIRDIRAAGQLVKNVVEQKLGPTMSDEEMAENARKWRHYREVLNRAQELMLGRPAPRPEPQETPEERARMAAFLAEVAKPKETK